MIAIFRAASVFARCLIWDELVRAGHRPSEIGRAQRGDVDFGRRVWIHRDGKGGFCPGVVLNDDMLEAWTLFDRVDAWGPFDSGSFAARIRAAGLPPHLTPYQLRHTVGIVLSEAGVDLRDIADHLGHRTTDMTRRHYVPVLHSRLAHVSAVLSTRTLGWKADDPSPVTAVGDGTAKPSRQSAKAEALTTTRRRA